MADYGRRSMSGYTYGGSAGQYAANLVGGRLDPSGYIEVVDRTVEGTAIPEIILGATETTVSGFHRP
jgi:hypothetical protein